MSAEINAELFFGFPLGKHPADAEYWADGEARNECLSVFREQAKLWNHREES